MRRLRRPIAATIIALTLVAACGTGDEEDTGAGGTVTVFAAASLTDAFTALGQAFEDANPGVEVEFNFGGSSGLREQILAGAPTDVFASANQSNMAAVDDAGLVTAPAVFATNRLQIAVPSGNSAGITGLEDFANTELLIGLCAVEVPCGDFGREALTNAGVEPSLDTEEPDVRALLTKIGADELDAGIVYVTDIAASDGRVEGIDIPDADNVVASYPIAALADAGPNATAFVEFVLGPDGQAILADYDFGPPDA